MDGRLKFSNGFFVQKVCAVAYTINKKIILSVFEQLNNKLNILQ